jgi:hypothetical protein
VLCEDFSALKNENFKMEGAEGHIRQWKAVVSLLGTMSPRLRPEVCSYRSSPIAPGEHISRTLNLA